MDVVIVVVAVVVIVTSICFNIWLFRKAIKLQQRVEAEAKNKTYDAATSLHRDLNNLRQQRFSVPMQQRVLQPRNERK